MLLVFPLLLLLLDYLSTIENAARYGMAVRSITSRVFFHSFFLCHLSWVLSEHPVCFSISIPVSIDYGTMGPWALDRDPGSLFTWLLLALRLGPDGVHTSPALLGWAVAADVRLGGTSSTQINSTWPCGIGLDFDRLLFLSEILNILYSLFSILFLFDFDRLFHTPRTTHHTLVDCIITQLTDTFRSLPYR